MESNTEADTRFDGLVDLLLTVGYVDGVFDQREKDFVRRYLDHLVGHVALGGGAGAIGLATHFDDVFARLEGELADLAAEVMATGDDNYITNRLKVRAVTLFRGFAQSDQAVALELVHGLVKADGTVTPIEQKLHDELVGYFRAPKTTAQLTAPIPPGELLELEAVQSVDHAALSHPLLDALEHPYAADASARAAQIGGDYELIFAAITAWERQRARGNGRLTGVADVGQIAAGTQLLDGHVHVLRPDRLTELIVLGDLHGCYACLKAALLQSDFIGRARRYQADPSANPDVKLVLLGDYLDRGRFGFEGVLRAALQLFVTFPSQVILLRGNHEFFVRVGNEILSAVQPAESIPAVRDLLPVDILDAYRHLFDHMPTSFLFDRTLFVHGGIPREDTTATRYRDLASLDDPAIRFEMMWSDPVDVDEVPAALQRESPRFTFGREQFRAFMARLGCHAMIRGHEVIEAGFQRTLEVDGRQLYTLFSAGGRDNVDLPPDSRYRNVTPMALTLRRDDTSLRATPWAIRYQPFCSGEHNGLYR